MAQAQHRLTSGLASASAPAGVGWGGLLSTPPSQAAQSPCLGRGRPRAQPLRGQSPRAQSCSQTQPPRAHGALPTWMAACLACRAFSCRAFRRAASFWRCSSRMSPSPHRCCRWPCASRSHAGVTGGQGRRPRTTPLAPNLPFLCPAVDEPHHRRPGAPLGRDMAPHGRAEAQTGTHPRPSAGADRSPRGMDVGRSSVDPRAPETLWTRWDSVRPRAAPTPTLTSRLATSRRSRLAAPSRCRCTCRRYQRWMVTAAWLTRWINLPRERTQDPGAPHRPSGQSGQQPHTRPFFRGPTSPPAVTVTRNWKSPQGHHLRANAARADSRRYSRAGRNGLGQHKRPQAGCSRHRAF